MSTALVVAGGGVAVSRPVSDSFAVVVPHDNLEGYEIGLNPNQGKASCDNRKCRCQNRHQ